MIYIFHIQGSTCGVLCVYKFLKIDCWFKPTSAIARAQQCPVRHNYFVTYEIYGQPLNGLLGQMLILKVKGLRKIIIIALPYLSSCTEHSDPLHVDTFIPNVPKRSLSS